MCGRKKEVDARYWILKEEVEGVVDMQTDCVHTDHNSNNAPRWGKTVEDCYRGNNPRKHVLLHRMYSSREGENMGRRMTWWMKRDLDFGEKFKQLTRKRYVR